MSERSGPEELAAHRHALAVALEARGEREAALEAFADAVRLAPDDPAIRTNQGHALARAGRLDDALAAYRTALDLAADFVPALLGLGAVLRTRDALEEAEAVLRRATQAAPDDAVAWLNLASVLIRRGALGPAEDAAVRALALSPQSPNARANLAQICRDQGRHAEALAHYRAALEIRADPRLHDNYLVGLNYSAGQDPDAVFAEHRRWAALHGRAEGPAPVFSPAGPGPLRVGYVSPDFCTHPVAFFLEAVLRHHDPARVQVHAYASLNAPADAMTARLRALVPVWRDIRALDDAAAAQRIREDGIDVLIDLAGHTRGNRLGVFAQRAAPVQATWIGYPHTTGLDAVDVRLTDAEADPPGPADRRHSERLVRLPRGFLCYSPQTSPPVGPPPAARNGFVTFGSFNNAFKISTDCVRLWSALLAAVPGARLLLKSRGLDDPATRAAFGGAFAAAGVDAARLELLGRVPGLEGHLAVYDRVDIALDTTPYNGTTTTCEALWMGVPVLTLTGAVHAARVGTSLLTRVGLDDFIAPSEEAFVRTGAAKAADPEALATLRAGLRDRVDASPLTDGPGFTRALEDTLIALRRGGAPAV